MFRWVHLWAVLASIAALTGCATNPRLAEERLTSPEGIKPDEGFVLVKVIDVQRSGLLNLKWKTLFLTNAQEEGIALNNRAPEMAAYSLYLSTVPAGEYRIAGFGNEGQSPQLGGLGSVLAPIVAGVIQGLTYDSKDVKAQFSSFQVKARGVTNLGIVLLATPPQGTGLPAQAVVLADETGLASALDDVPIADKPSLSGRQHFGWDQNPGASAAAAASKIIRQYATTISPMNRTLDGRVIVGGPLGQIHVRIRHGAWESRSVGGLDTIVSVRELDDGRIFAGTDNGMYYLWQPSQRQWHRIALPNRDSFVVELEPVGTEGYVIQVVTRPRTGGLNFSFLLKRKLEESGNEKELLSIEKVYGLPRRPMYFDGDDLIVYSNHTGFPRRATLYRINPRTLVKRIEQVDYFANDVHRLADGTFVLERSTAIGSVSWSFSNNGRDWNHQGGTGPYDARFVNPRLGYGLRVQSTGWATLLRVLDKTEDGGNTWVQVGTPIETKGGPFILSPGPGEIVGQNGGNITSTTDEGKSWQLEWPTD